MDCLIKILNLNTKKTRIGLFKIEDKELETKKIITIDLSDGVFDKILSLLNQNFMKAKIENGILIDVTMEEQQPRNDVPDDFEITRLILLKNEGVMEKKDYYEKFCEYKNCTRRTAETHLSKAINLGIVTHFGRYAIRLNKNEEIEKDEE